MEGGGRWETKRAARGVGGGGGEGRQNVQLGVVWTGRVGGQGGVGGGRTYNREGVEWGVGGEERGETKTNKVRCPLILVSPQPTALSWCSLSQGNTSPSGLSVRSFRAASGLSMPLPVFLCRFRSL